MANPKIEVEVGGNVKGLQQAANQVEASMGAIEKAARSGANSVDAIKQKFSETNGTIQVLQSRLSELKKNLESATDIKSIANYNRRIQETANELARVKSLGVQSTEVKIDSREVAKLVLNLQKAKAEIDRLKQPIELPAVAKFVQAEGMIAKLQQRLSNLRSNLENATDVKSIVKYNIRIQQTQEELSRLSKLGTQISNSAVKASTGVAKLTKETSSYNATGIEFARIIQDAPYGIIGVGNNITQLAQAFQDARNKGQSFTKILGGIFAGSNALVLGISVLTTAFTILQQKGFFKTEESAESLEDRLESYRDTLDAVSRASIEGASSAQKEAQTLNLLRAQAENTNVPIAKRLEAVRDLKKEFPEYLKSLTDEQVLTGDVGKAYEELTKKLIATAKARASSDQIAKNSLSILTLEQQAQDRVSEILDKRQKLSKLEAFAQNQATKSRGETTGLDLQILELRSQILKLSNQQVDDVNKINDINKENLSLEENITKLISDGANFTKEQVESSEKLKIAEDEVAKAIEYQNKLRADALAKYKELTKELSNRKPIVNTNIDLSGYQTEETPENAPAAIFSFQSQIDELLEFNDVFSKTLGAIGQFQKLSAMIASDASIEEKLGAIGEQAQMIQGAFDALGSAVKDAFGQSNSFLGTLLGNLISFAGRIIAQYFAIAAAAALAGASESAAATGPGAIFTLPAFLALGAGLVAAAFSSIGGGKKINTGSGAAGLGQGTNFLGTTSDTFSANQSISLSGDWRIDGKDLVYIIDRNTESKN